MCGEAEATELLLSGLAEGKQGQELGVEGVTRVAILGADRPQGQRQKRRGISYLSFHLPNLMYIKF